MIEPHVLQRGGPPEGSAPSVSVVLPIFNEEPTIAELYRRVTAALIEEAYELVFVNDGSADRSGDLLAELARGDRRVRVVNFSRNFGHQIAITAGLDNSRGRAVIVMDPDLQDPPEVAPSLLGKWREGYDVVYAVRTERLGEGSWKRGTARLFYALLRKLTRLDIPANVGDFRLSTRSG